MEEAIAQAYKSMSPCGLCPRECGVKRAEGETGFCGIGKEALVSSAGPHFGEEAVLVGQGGSGTIFFAGCNLLCIFCQNYELSHGREGRATTEAAIAGTMLRLQEMGCHNVNFVTPTHVAPQMMGAIKLAREGGLTVPTVYNCGGYESVETLKLLEGFIDIYMPDAKYWDSAHARALSSAPDYPAVLKAALKEMHRQVGDLETAEGIATRGLLVRHLVMPNDLAGSREIIDFLADEISENTFINVMGQYRPVSRAHEYPLADRFPTADEFHEAYGYAAQSGLRLAR